MIAAAANIAAIMLGLALVLAGFRLLRGPTVADRVLALDTCYINALALIVVLGVRRGDASSFEVAIVIALLGFVGTVCFAKYLLRGDIIE